MPWKQGYTISDERSIEDSDVRWPDGARCCVAVTVDLSVASGPEGVTAADLATPEALFGANQGLAAEGHEIAAHGFRHEDISGIERDEEWRRILRTTEILADTVGHEPTGWFSLPRQGNHCAVGAISPNTIDLLLETGCLYPGNGLADDLPYYSVGDLASRRALLTLPYYYHFDDQFFLMFPRDGTGGMRPGSRSDRVDRRATHRLWPSALSRRGGGRNAAVLSA